MVSEIPASSRPQPRFCLVHGPRKAGTTMLQALLDTPDRLLMRPGELKLKRLYVPRMLGLEDQAAIFREISDLHSGEYTHDGDPGEAYRSALSDAIGQGAAVDALVTLEVLEMRRRLAPQLPPVEPDWIAFKEVGGRLDTVLHAARLLFPRLKVVLICRSPQAVSSAIYRSRRRRGQRMGLRSLLQQAVEPWQVLLRQMVLAGAPGLFLLSYEDLVQDPAAAAARLEAFLELPVGSLSFDATTQFGRPTTSRTASVDTSAVFVSQAPWQRGLSPLEVLLVLAAAGYFRLRLLLLVLAGRRRWLSYRAFAASLLPGASAHLD